MHKRGLNRVTTFYLSGLEIDISLHVIIRAKQRHRLKPQELTRRVKACFDVALVQGISTGEEVDFVDGQGAVYVVKKVRWYKCVVVTVKNSA